MTELKETVEQYEFALLSRLTQFHVTPEALRDIVDMDFVRALKGWPPDAEVTIEPDEPPVIDTALVHSIAVYLINTEELDEDFLNPDERDRVISIGMFIYGWEQEKKEVATLG